MKCRLKTILVIVVLACITALLVWVFMRGRKESAMEQERERPVKGASRASMQDEESIVTLGVDAQKRGGIMAVPVEAMTHTEKIHAYGIILQLQNLTELRNNYVQAKTQFEKALTSLDFSKREYERLKVLNEDNKNVSDKALQAAEATRLNDEANVHALQEALNVLENTAHQQWGSILAGWLLSGSPSFHRLVKQKDVLIQLTLPAGVHITRTHRSISIVLADGSIVSAGFVSLSPRTDPRIQGTSLFYAAPSGMGKLLTGMNVTADLPSGPSAKGVFIPASSVVWWQGKSWVYVKQDTEHFVRREVSVESPVDNGYFSVKNFMPGEQIVVKGAQILLSEEFRPKTRAREED